jgi:hypothetical protein
MAAPAIDPALAKQFVDLVDDGTEQGITWPRSTRRAGYLLTHIERDREAEVIAIRDEAETNGGMSRIRDIAERA